MERRGIVGAVVRWTVLLLGVIVILGGIPSDARAQQKIGYIDTQYILKKLPEYATVQQKLDKLEQKWQAEIKKKKKKVQQLEDEYQAWELLYTKEERKKKRQAIQKARKEVEQLRQQYFGPKGRLYTRQQELMRPIQQRVLKAAEEVATQEGYDYVFDRGGKVLFIYARDEHNLSDPVLRQLGVNPDQKTSRRGN